MRIFNFGVTSDDKRTWLVEHVMSSHWLLQIQYLGNRGWKSFGAIANAEFYDNLLERRLDFVWARGMTKYDIDLNTWMQTGPEPAANKTMLRCVGLTDGAPMLRMLRMWNDEPSTRTQYMMGLISSDGSDFQ